MADKRNIGGAELLLTVGEQMPDALFHPEHVANALARYDGINDEDMRLAVVATRAGTEALPPAVYVRLLRRYQVDPYPRLERAAQNALVHWIKQWIGRNYPGLSFEDKQEMTQELAITVVKAVLATTGIDWWEIRFVHKLTLAAADHYEKLFDPGLKAARIDINDQPEDFHDGGAFARELESNERLQPWLANILDPEELVLVAPLLIWDLPICSEKARIDAVRLLGIPEGTLREKKAAMIKKVKAALEKEAL